MDQEAKWGDAIRKTTGGGWYSTTGLRDHGSPRSKDAIFKTMFETVEFEPLDYRCAHVARKIQDCILVKERKLQESGFAKFDANWLLISDYDVGGLSVDDCEAGTLDPHLLKLFNSGAGKGFDRIFVQYGFYWWQWRQGQLAAKFHMRGNMALNSKGFRRWHCERAIRRLMAFWGQARGEPE